MLRRSTERWLPCLSAEKIEVPTQRAACQLEPAEAIGQAVIQQGYRVLYREAHKLLEDLAEATLDGTRKQ
jgi:hypothetical protein